MSTEFKVFSFVCFFIKVKSLWLDSSCLMLNLNANMRPPILSHILHNNYSTLFETDQNPLGKYSAWSLFDGLINLSIFGRKSNSSGITYTFPFHQMKEETFRKCGLFLSSNISRNGRKGIYMNMIKNIFKRHFYLEMWNRIYV